jgi:hypothetical protein
MTSIGHQHHTTKTANNGFYNGEKKAKQWFGEIYEADSIE